MVEGLREIENNKRARLGLVQLLKAERGYDVRIQLQINRSRLHWAAD